MDNYSMLERILKTIIIPKVQRGTVAATVAGVNVTINPVNMATTLPFPSSGRAANDSITLVNATTINVKSSVAGNVDWQVVDFGGGA